MKSALVISTLLFLVLLVLGGSVLLTEERSFLIRSRASVSLASDDNSYFFVTPACGARGSSVRLTGFVLNSSGKGAANLQCVVSTNDARLDINSIQAVTDSYGKVIFDISSASDGVYEVSVTCGDTLLTSDQRVCFQ